jgi:hypothetical protein
VKILLSVLILPIFITSCTITPIDDIGNILQNSSNKDNTKRPVNNNLIKSGSANSNYKNALELINNGKVIQGTNILQQIVDNYPDYTPAKIMLDRLESPFSMSTAMVEKYIEDWINAPSSIPEFVMEKPEVPELPERPVLTKDEFESTKQFSSRVAVAEKEYKEQVDLTRESYKKSIDNYNNAVDEYNSKIDWERKSRIEKIPAMRKRYLDVAFAEVLGNPSLQNLTYNADEEVFYGQVAAEYSNFKLNIEIPVVLSKAQDFKKNVDNIRPNVKIEVIDGNIVFSKVDVTSNGITYNAKLLNSDENIKSTATKIIDNSVTIGDDGVVIDNMSIEKIKPLKVKQITKDNRQFFIPKI